jgi:hypothetical protein
MILCGIRASPAAAKDIVMTGETHSQWSEKTLALELVLLLAFDSDSCPTTWPGDTKRVTFLSNILQHDVTTLAQRFEFLVLVREQTCLTRSWTSDGV